MSGLDLKLLFEMNEKARKLVDLMKKGIVEFVFVKKSTGKRRTAHGTLKRDLIPPESQRKRGRPKKRPSDLVIYYDTDKKAIRSFKDELLKSFVKTAEDPKKSASKEASSKKADKQKDKEAKK